MGKPVDLWIDLENDQSRKLSSFGRIHLTVYIRSRSSADLEVAINSNSLELCKSALSHGADPKGINMDGKTMKQLARERGLSEFLQLMEVSNRLASPNTGSRSAADLKLKAE